MTTGDLTHAAHVLLQRSEIALDTAPIGDLGAAAYELLARGYVDRTGDRSVRINASGLRYLEIERKQSDGARKILQGLTVNVGAANLFDRDRGNRRAGLSQRSR